MCDTADARILSVAAALTLPASITPSPLQATAAAASRIWGLPTATHTHTRTAATAIEQIKTASREAVGRRISASFGVDLTATAANSKCGAFVGCRGGGAERSLISIEKYAHLGYTQRAAATPAFCYIYRHSTALPILYPCCTHG